MKILVSCLSRSWGGMEMYVISSIKLLINEGSNISLVCLKNSPIERASKELPIEVITFDSASKSVKNLFYITKLLNNTKYDLIHTHFSKDLWLIVPALRMLNLSTPLVMTKHLGSAVRKKDLLHRFLYERVDHAIAISNIIKDNLLDTTPLKTERVSVIHNFVDLDKYRRHKYSSKLRNEFLKSESTALVGLVGRITPGKGHEDVIEAVKILKGKDTGRNLDFKIIIVGSASENEKEFEDGLKEKIRDYGLEEIFYFTGFRKDVPELLACFDVFLFPSRAEAFGLALLEAMAAGIANIACYSDGVKDIALKDLTSLTYERNDINSLAEEIALLVSNGNLRSFLAENSYKRAEKFNADIFQAKIFTLYRKLINYPFSIYEAPSVAEL